MSSSKQRLLSILAAFLSLAVSLFPSAASAVRPSGVALSPSPSAHPSDEATITYKKVFKSSYPEFVEIKLNEAGSGTFDIRQLSDDSSPQPFQIGSALVQKIFDMAGKLHDFEGIDLEVHRRLANLGDKTFRFQKGSETHEVNFNYTLDSTATQLVFLFEGLSRQELDLSDLQRTIRYDHLGVNDALLQIEADYSNKLLPEPERFLATLKQVTQDQKFIDIARQRAQTLTDRIQSAAH
jgi:hypothetical protein